DVLGPRSRASRSRRTARWAASCRAGSSTSVLPGRIETLAKGALQRGGQSAECLRREPSDARDIATSRRSPTPKERSHDKSRTTHHQTTNELCQHLLHYREACTAHPARDSRGRLYAALPRRLCSHPDAVGGKSHGGGSAATLPCEP